MADIDFLSAYRRDAVALLDIVERDPQAHVPACPGWRAIDLAWHVGIVAFMWRQLVSREVEQRRDFVAPERLPDGEVLAWARDGVARLGALLASSDSSATCSTFAGDRDVAWVRRRVAHEMAVHRHDAEEAHGTPAPIETPLAADGVDEFLRVFLPAGDLTGEGERVRLRAPDAAREWIAMVRDETVSVLDAAPGGLDHIPVDASVEGSVHELLLLVWGRRAPDGLRLDGDRAALARFLARGRR